MKIRNRHLLRAAGWTGTRFIKTLSSTLRTEYRPLEKSWAPEFVPLTDRIIYCIWHENLLLPTVSFGCSEIAVLISKHADGQLLGSLITSLGMEMVSGSTNRGGIEAVRKMIGADVSWRHLAVTPDGPRGPRRVVQSGIIYVASRTGMKIVPVGVGYGRAWRLGSWDRFAIPKPFARAKLLSAESIVVPSGLKAANLEPYRVQVQAEMDRLNALAEHWADSGQLILTNSAEPTRLAS